MDAIRRWNARRRAPSYKALMDAGPPTTWLAVAGAIALVVVGCLYALNVGDGTVLIAVPLVAFAVACFVDRRGWRIRMASAELATLQRDRWAFGDLPADRLSAEAWLRAYPSAPNLYQAAIMVMAGRPREARALVDEVVAQTPEDALRVARLRLTLDAQLGGAPLDRAAIEAFERMPELRVVTEAERRFHRLSLAWSRAWLQINANRPWRDDFASSLRALGPFKPPARFVAFHAIQQFALPVAYAMAWVIVAWLGLLDFSR
jgi:hypothetical protein